MSSSSYSTDEFDVEHTTLQVDHQHTQLLAIEPAEQQQRTIHTAT